MEQLTQSLKNGIMQLVEVPFPALLKGSILVRNYYSIISSGTEGKTVKDSRLGYIGKAKARKEEVKKVLDAARTFGLKDTYRMVMNKLDTPVTLGYSCAGEVIAVADDVTNFNVGDFVACGGNTANHAEVVAVPVNLCVKVDKRVSPNDAAFTTIGAIAMQGVRQADLRLGENCTVIGLGLVGQLTIQLLNAAGIKTIGVDVDEKMVEFAKINGCSVAISRQADDLEQRILQYTNGHGCDAVIITAGTDSTDPVDLAGSLCRQKGKVIIVGGVPTGFKRSNYFKKELDLRMSCSYGPGRYDSEYEEQGIDYPYGYVRWTENRNMQAFVDLLAEQKINLQNILTHTFDFKNAGKAYDLILEKSEPFLGIALKYDLNKEVKKSVLIADKKVNAADMNIGLVGAGSFGQNFLLPALKGMGSFVNIATARPHNARNLADKYGFARASGNADEVINDKDVNTIFIATRHDTHAGYVLKSLEKGKNVFVEKPLCLTLDELENIRSAYVKNNARLMLGFNRRFAPMTQKIKNVFDDSMPKSILCRINAGVVPKDHWIHNPETGGGRILGEVCHFIDLCMHLAGAKITSVSANSLSDSLNLDDSLIINLSFANGSIAAISYFSNGNKNISKEYFEIYGSGKVAICNDFKKLDVFGKGKTTFSETQDKGHKNEIAAFADAIKTGKPSPISFDDIYLSTLATFKVLESISDKGKVISL
ncbi:MAG: bi-domain-containing oxidoreductase [Bacteroidia bacterium]